VGQDDYTVVNLMARYWLTVQLLVFLVWEVDTQAGAVMRLFVRARDSRAGRAPTRGSVCGRP